MKFTVEITGKGWDQTQNLVNTYEVWLWTSRNDFIDSHLHTYRLQ